METALGWIVIEVDLSRAPITGANFLKYVEGGFYDGGLFHRATRADNYPAQVPERPLLECIQAGVAPEREAEAFAPIRLEHTGITGLQHVAGTVAMGRRGPDTATSDFFILINDQPSLDYGGTRIDDRQGTAAFGRVVQGMDVVVSIQAQRVEGQRLVPPVSIRRARLY